MWVRIHTQMLARLYINQCKLHGKFGIINIDSDGNDFNYLEYERDLAKKRYYDEDNEDDYDYLNHKFGQIILEKEESDCAMCA